MTREAAAANRSISILLVFLNESGEPFAGACAHGDRENGDEYLLVLTVSPISGDAYEWRCDRYFIHHQRRFCRPCGASARAAG
jgi:hypothetical protein